MSHKKTDLYTIESALITKYSKEAVESFLSSTSAGGAPSLALKKFIQQTHSKKLDSSVILDLLRKAYPGIDISSISGTIHDSGYPFGNPNDLNDETFDQIITQAYENPPEW